MITITRLGEPVPFARTRIAKTGTLFTPDRQRSAMAELRILAWQEMAAQHGGRMLDEPLRLEMLAEFSIPARWSNRQRQRAIIGEILPAKRPDIDNLFKLAADALNQIVYRDDALIVEARIRKRYSLSPKIVLTIAPVNAEAAAGGGL
ncbi:MAG TPA: RusA family crossover junction endodeoxyribonuclease [Stellaceae bacterium]|nr:RusA family crossover junction endodeoxyribonuclease [Stellaceae bacterium]